MDDRYLLRTGIAGGVVAGLCCVTPILGLVLGAIGLSAWLAYADYVILPLLVGFIALAGVGIWRLRRARSCGRVGDSVISQ